jgi:hypothetical protein
MSVSHLHHALTGIPALVIAVAILGVLQWRITLRVLLVAVIAFTSYGVVAAIASLVSLMSRLHL